MNVHLVEQDSQVLFLPIELTNLGQHLCKPSLVSAHFTDGLNGEVSKMVGHPHPSDGSTFQLLSPEPHLN